MKPDKYISALTQIGDRRPRFHLGQCVADAIGRRGVVHVIYANLDSAINAFAVPEEWYEMQETQPKTPKNGFWYAVVLTSEQGDVLLGEDDMGAVPHGR